MVRPRLACTRQTPYGLCHSSSPCPDFQGDFGNKPSIWTALVDAPPQQPISQKRPLRSFCLGPHLTHIWGDVARLSRFPQSSNPPGSPRLAFPQLSESETHNLALNYTLCSLIILCLISSRLELLEQSRAWGQAQFSAWGPALLDPMWGAGDQTGSLVPTVGGMGLVQRHPYIHTHQVL